jgi:hypothetical protein
MTAIIDDGKASLTGALVREAAGESGCRPPAPPRVVIVPQAGLPAVDEGVHAGCTYHTEGGTMTAEDQRFALYWAKFVQTFPVMNDHVAWLRFHPDQEPERVLDGVARVAFLRWCWLKGYGNREALCELLSFMEQRTGCSILKRQL